MDSPGASGRRRGATKLNAEDQALDQIAKEVVFFKCEYKFRCCFGCCCQRSGTTIMIKVSDIQTLAL